MEAFVYNKDNFVFDDDEDNNNDDDDDDSGCGNDSDNDNDNDNDNDTNIDIKNTFIHCAHFIYSLYSLTIYRVRCGTRQWNSV